MIQHLFVLAGNGPYENRGCEAIVRGTVEIIRKHFESPRFIVCSHVRSRAHLALQQRNERDSAIQHVMYHRPPRFENKLLARVSNRLFRSLPTMRQTFQYRDLLPRIKTSSAILSVGGDNYSLDYGLPLPFTDLDDLAARYRKDLIIFGASVGPFSKLPDYEAYMAAHLRQQSAIFARESTTIEYLQGIGVSENVHRVIDPAFVMTPQRPADAAAFPRLGESIGINLSPMMARYVCNGDETAWLERATEIVTAVHQRFQRPLLLVPHVFEGNSDDLAFLRAVQQRAGLAEVSLLSGSYSAAELKWFISQLFVFAGARTHSTIAAFSTVTPTVSFAYSIKAEGLNRDIYGDLSYCIAPSDLTPERACCVIGTAIAKEREIRASMEPTISRMITNAYESGRMLRDLVEGKLK